MDERAIAVPIRKPRPVAVPEVIAEAFLRRPLVGSGFPRLNDAKKPPRVFPIAHPRPSPLRPMSPINCGLGYLR
jgi:hypothetical protein